MRASTHGRHAGNLPLVTDAYRSFTYSTKCYAGPVAPGTYDIPAAKEVSQVKAPSTATIFGVTEDAIRRARLIRTAEVAGADTANMQYYEDNYVFEALRHIEED